MSGVAQLSGDAGSEKQMAHTISVEAATDEDFVVALADRDSERLEACYHSGAHLRALVPSGFQERKGSSAVAERFMSWFGDPETIEALEKNVYLVSDRLHIDYRFRLCYSDGESELVEQDTSCELRDGSMVDMDLLCTGFRPERRAEPAAVASFDAGELGCSSGLPDEFRRQIDAIPVGSVLEILTRDPSAKEDLPSLTRLLGHRVITVRNSPDGSTILVVQRGR